MPDPFQSSSIPYATRDPFHGNGVPLLKDEQETLGMVSAAEQKMGDDNEFGMPQRKPPSSRTAFLRSILRTLKGRKHALLKSLIHLPSVAITLGVLSLTFAHVFWEAPTEGTNAVLNSLQFAAHLHGSLIIMSLSAMLLHFIHRSLSSKDGVPLGFIASGFQLNSLSYMFCKEFRFLDSRYTVIFLGTFALAMLSGPSSAIIMIPRLQFWRIDNIWIGPGNMDFRVYIQANESTLYPDTLTADNAPPQCLQSNASILSECPAYGMRRWLMTDEELFNVGYTSFNKTIEDGWVRYMVGQGPPYFEGTQSNYVATTLSNFLGQALMSFSTLLANLPPADMGGNNGLSTIQFSEDVLARYDLSFRSAGKQIATRKPLVEVECEGYPANTTYLSLPHDMFLWPSSPNFTNTQWIYPASDFSSLSVDLNSTIVNSSWVDIEMFPSDQPRPSLGAFFATPETLFDPFSQESYSLYSCTIDARWASTYALLDASSGQPLIFDGNPNPNGELLTSIFDDGPSPVALPSIYISNSWSTALNPLWIDSITTPVPSNRTILDTIGQICLDSHTLFNSSLNGSPFSDGLSHRVMTGPMPMLECLQVALAVYLADALSRVQDSVPTYFVSEGQITPSYQNGETTNIFMVQDLYFGSVVSFEPPEDNLTLPGAVTTISKADLADPARFTEMYMDPQRYGYGYGFQDSKLVFFGASILLLHVATCLVYVVWIIGIGEHKSAGWESLGELLWVALGSDPVSMESEDQRLWREKVIVEERRIDETDIRGGTRMVLIRAPDDDRRMSRDSGGLEYV